MYVCEYCGYSTSIKCNYVRHMNKKMRCEPLVNVRSQMKGVFTKVGDTSKWRCNACDKEISKYTKRKHFESTCRRGLSILQCEHCHEMFDSANQKSRHKRNCKGGGCNHGQNDMRHGLMGHGNIGTYINGDQHNNNITNINNIVINFGNEEIDYLLENSVDPRVKIAFNNLLDMIDIVHFNIDHPENQTIRKLNKKSDLIEFKQNNRWEHESCATGLPKLRHNLESKLKTTFTDADDLMAGTKLRELLYHKSKRGDVSENDVLNKYTGDSLQLLCLQECESVRAKFLQTISPNMKQTPCVITYLNKLLDKVREKYNQQPVSV